MSIRETDGAPEELLSAAKKSLSSLTVTLICPFRPFLPFQFPVFDDPNCVAQSGVPAFVEKRGWGRGGFRPNRVVKLVGPVALSPQRMAGGADVEIMWSWPAKRYESWDRARAKVEGLGRNEQR